MPHRLWSYPRARLITRRTSLLFAFMVASLSFRKGWPGKAESRFPCRSGAGHLYRIAHDPHRQCPSCISQISAICQKRGRSFTPLPLDSLYPGSLPASSHSPKISERLGSCPYSWEILSRPCPLDTSRTPYRTSGLPAGAELSSESKDIIASTNPKCPDTFEYNRTTQLHDYGATWLRKGKNKGSHRCSDRWRDHAGSTSIEFSTVDRD